MGASVAAPPQGDLEIRYDANLIFSQPLPGNAVFDTAFPCMMGQCPPANVLPLPVFTLRLGTLDPLSLRYRSPLGSTVTFPGASFPREVTLDLFVRDPSEYKYRIETTALGLPDPWVTEMASPRGYPRGEIDWSTHPPFLLPNAVQLSYRGAYPAQYTTFKPVLPHAFWGINIRPSPETGPFPTDHSDWGPPGNLPLDWGSIKTIRAAAHSICESEIPVQDVLNAIRITLPRKVNSNCFHPITAPVVGVIGYVVNADIRTLSASSYLFRQHSTRYGTPRELDGGFDLWGEFYFHATGVLPTPVGAYPFDKACTADTSYQYPWVLIDGFLGVASLGNISTKLVGDGQACGELGPLLASTLGLELPATIRDVARARQKHPMNIACQVTKTPGTGVLSKSCENAATWLRYLAEAGAVSLFGSNANVPPALLAQVQIAANDGAAYPDGSGNWECAEVPEPISSSTDSSTPTCMTKTGPPEDRQYTCNFILRAKSIVVNPDSVDLVWFDDLLDHYCNYPTCQPASLPGIVLFLATFLGNDVGSLCSRPLFRTDDFVSRYFATSHQGAITCADKLGAPPDRCCSSAADCNASETCDTVNHRCGFGLCSMDATCPGFQRCDVNAGRCVTPPVSSCDARDPFVGCGKKMVCEWAGGVRPWFPPANRTECRRR